MKCGTQEHLINSIPLIINNSIANSYCIIDKIAYDENKQKALEEEIEKYKVYGLYHHTKHISDETGDFVYICLYLIE